MKLLPTALRIAICGAFCHAMASGAPFTPDPGSPERVALCDALRAHVVREYSNSKPKKKVVFKISYLKVDGNFAFFQGEPIYEDGTQATYECLMDMDYSFLLEKKSGAWHVLADFCSTDVPPDSWWRGVRRSLPANLPASIIPDYYRRHLGL